MADLDLIGDLLHFLGWIGKKVRMLFNPKGHRIDADNIRIIDFLVGGGVLVALFALVFTSWMIFAN